MSPVEIIISEDLYKKLERMAVGFDSPENVIERLVNKHATSEGVDPGVRQSQGIESNEMINREIRVRTSSKMTKAMIEQSYQAGKDVFAGKEEKDKAIADLVENVGMNPSSARIYVETLGRMLRGQSFASINPAATEYFLENIRKDFGKERFQNALDAVGRYIEYYYNRLGHPPRKIKEVHQRFSRLLSSDSNYFDSSSTSVDPNTLQGQELGRNEITRMTKEMIELSYEAGKKVLAEEEGKDEAINDLVANTGMNPNSAKMYVDAFLKMMTGECYNRAINAEATEYYLENIHRDFGKVALQNALDAVEQHIEYEGGYGHPPRKIKEVHQRFSRLLSSDSNYFDSSSTSVEPNTLQGQELGWNERTKITKEMIELSYEAGKKVFAGEEEKDEAINDLVANTGMNPNSATMYVNAFLKMMTGECYNRRISAEATEYFLENIHRDFGKIVLQNALDAVEQHIEYEGGYGLSSSNIKEVHQRFSRFLSSD